MSRSAILLCPASVDAQELVRVSVNDQHVDFPTGDGTQSLQVTGALGETPWYVMVCVASNAGDYTSDYRSNEDLDAEPQAIVSQLRPLVVDFNRFEPARDLLAQFLRSQGEDARRFWLDTDYGRV